MKLHFGRTLFTALASTVAFLVAPVAQSQRSATDLSLGQAPRFIHENQEFQIDFLIGALRLPGQMQTSYVVNENDIIIFYQIDPGHLVISPQPPPTNEQIVQRIAGLPAGSYDVYTVPYFDRDGDGYDSDAFSLRDSDVSHGTVTIHPGEASLKFGLTSPKSNEVVEGINVIRGWACYPAVPVEDSVLPARVGHIAYQIDNRPVRRFAYGSTQRFTRNRCNGTTDTGFAASINWNNYPRGERTLTLFVDGQEVLKRKVYVSKP